MLRIKKGPMIERYAECCVGIDLDDPNKTGMNEILDWINEYINGPWSEGLEIYVEKTEIERRDSIMEYIARCIHNSTYGQIKLSLELEKWIQNPSDAPIAEV